MAAAVAARGVGAVDPFQGFPRRELKAFTDTKLRHRLRD